MKVVIWIGVMLVANAIASLLSINDRNDILIVSILMALIYVVAAWIAVTLCKSWDRRREEKALSASKKLYEAEEKAKREAEEKAKREVEKPAAEQEHTPTKNEKPLSEKLEYALKFQTDEGMIRFLSKVNDESVQAILNSPPHLVREQIQELLDQL